MPGYASTFPGPLERAKGVTVQEAGSIKVNLELGKRQWGAGGCLTVKEGEGFGDRPGR